MDKDSDKRQRAAIEAYAKAAGYEIVDTFYDAAVSGADPVTDRPGFTEMLERLMSNGARTILVESPETRIDLTGKNSGTPDGRRSYGPNLHFLFAQGRQRGLCRWAALMA